LLEGVAWALFVCWLFLALSGIAEPASTTQVVLYGGGLLLGPLALIAGASLAMIRAYARFGAALTILGCAALTVFVVYNSVQALHVEPLQARPPYVLYATAVVVVLISDAGALRLYRAVSQAPPKS
jgi:hypothetical protein